MTQATAQPCSSCGVEVVFLEHVRTLRAAPIELVADVGGNIGINLLEGTYMVLNKAQLDDARRAGKKLHKNHFATCPEASRFHRTPARSRA